MRLVYKTLFPIILVLAGTALVAGVFLRSSLQDALLKEQFLQMQETVLGKWSHYISPATFTDPRSSDSQMQFRAFTEEIKDSTVARVTIWSTEKTVIYSDLTSIIGMGATYQPELERALAQGQPLYVRKKVDTNMPPQSAVGEFIDIYLPLYINGRLVGVVEIHSVAGAVLVPLSKELNQVVYILLASGILISIVVILIINVFVLSPLYFAGELARAVAGGDFEKRAVPYYHDETGELFKSLETMRVRLRSLVGNLENEVNVRTRKLLEEESRLAASLGSLSAGFVIVDMAGKIFYANTALYRVLHLLNTEPVTLERIAKRLQDVCDIPAHYLRCIRERKITDIKDVPLDAGFVRIFMAPVVLRHEVEEVIGAVVLIDDVTEAKVQERSKEEFFAIASHELRTPLAAIRANAALLKQFFATQTKNSDVQGIAEDIHTATLRLIKIVHDFLDASALEQRVIAPSLERLDIFHEVSDAVQQLQGLAKEKGIDLSLEKPSAALSAVRADKDRLKQVIINLIGNAINYTEKGSVRVSMVAKDDSVKVYVRDTGIGIMKERTTLLFRKFQQAGKDVLSRDVTQGTGLGLYISKLIMESMGGTIQLEESVRGEGSVFSVTIAAIE